MAISAFAGQGAIAPVSAQPLQPPGQFAENAPDHFVERDGVRFAGMHVIIDVWEASRLDDKPWIESVLRRVIDACGATLLHIHLHHFSPTGVSGVAVLAESHISVHTWPEEGFAAFDVFMCGDAKPELAVPILKQAFAAERVEVNEIRRGILDESV